MKSQRFYFTSQHISILFETYLRGSIYWRPARTFPGEEGKGRAWIVGEMRLTLEQVKPLIRSGLIKFEDDQVRNRLIISEIGRVECVRAALDQLKANPPSRWFYDKEAA